MKKRQVCFALLSMVCFLMLCACTREMADNSADEVPSPQELTWQEQYDLGVRYLSEGDYQEAILAFTAAIEIDPKRAPAYVGRGDAYVLSGETEENLSAAKVDYEKAIELEETNAEAYLGLADVYIRQGDYEKAYNILQESLEKISNDQRILDKIAEIESGVYSDSQNNIRRHNYYTADGTLIHYTVFEYDFLGRCCGWSNYYSDSKSEEYSDHCKVDFDDDNRPSQYRFYSSDGMETWHDMFEYDERGLKTTQKRYDVGNNLECYFLFYYDDEGKEIRYEGYYSDGSMYNYWVYEYDEQGNCIGEICYKPDGTQDGYARYS